MLLCLGLDQDIISCCNILSSKKADCNDIILFESAIFHENGNIFKAQFQFGLVRLSHNRTINLVNKYTHRKLKIVPFGANESN